MGVKTRRKQPKGADKDKKRGSPPDNAKGKRRSARTQKAQEDDTSKELPLKSISESKEKSNAKGARKENTRNNTTKRETKTEPMDIDKAEKPSNDAPSNDATTKDDAKKPPHKHHHHHHELNEETLKRIKAYLQSEKVNENLDEDAIAVKILRTDRATSERVKFLHDPFADSDEDNATDTTDSYQAAEEYTLALDFYKRAIAETQEEMPDVALDKRTLNWLRKALGLHRRNDLWETTGHEQPNAEETDESDGDEEGSQAGKAKNKRHVTRGMVRSTRIKRRAERKTKESMNLNALVSAVEDLEGEFGQFGENPASGQKKRKRQKDSGGEKDSSDEESPTIRRRTSKQKKDTWENPSRSKRKPRPKKDIFDRDLVATLTVKEKVVSKSGRRVKRSKKKEKEVKVRILIDGKDVRDTTPEKPKRSTKRNRKRSPSPVSVEEQQRRQAAAARKRVRKAAAAESEEKGLLFGEMDPHEAMGLEPCDYVEESNGISLGLLQWKRRQMCWDESGDGGDTNNTAAPARDVGTKAVPSKLTKARMTGDLPLWETCNFIPNIQTRPAAAEPPRRRHTDAKYADWINGMLNVLSGSGRSWALHEFFYSDIDRPWFNFDQFQVDAAKLGVPPTARLTRKEWSLVRRRIRKRPRRFSRRFIQSELAKLCQYRDIVRAIQHSETSMPDFGFDVPEYIRVGATVTAIHWKRRVLHRGIVLAHDPVRSGYLVQFERQELGFQFCPDYEVSSHGVPEIMIQTTSSSLEATNLGGFADHHSKMGELPYGTSYGPMYVDRLDPTKSDKLAKMSRLDAVVAEDGKLSAKDSIQSVTTAKKVAERETLVELIGKIDAALKRKTLLLDAIDKCNSDISSMKEESGPEGVNLAEDSAFKAHYSWLQANLRMTNQSLESSLLLLQTMYGKAYAEIGARPEEIEEENDVELENKLQRLCEDDAVSDDLVGPWSLSMAQASDKVASLVTSTANTLAGKWGSMTDEERLRAEYLEHSLTAACRLMLNVNYCGALVRSERADIGTEKGLTLNVPPMNACLERELESLDQRTLPKSSGKEPNIEKLQRADDMRSSAMKELQDALKSYETELVATHVAKKIIRS